MSEAFIVPLIILLAVFIQSLSGFGAALIAMALLPIVIGLHMATPLVALVMAAIETFLLLYYRKAFNWEAVWRIIAASFVGIPLGIIFLSRLDEGIVMTLLGVIITGYALYALLNIRLPTLSHPAWGYGFGLLAGMLGGAYNTSGPPVIVYGNCRNWKAEEFKSNLQGFFVVSSFAIVLGHALNRSFSPEIWRYFWISMPAMAIGVFAGTRLDRYIKPAVFRKIVLGLLIILGLWLIMS